MRQIKRLMKHASDTAFFQGKFGSPRGHDIIDLEAFSQKLPLMRLEELVAEKIRSGDPYSSRLCRNRNPLVTFQLEYDAEAALYLALDRADLKAYAEALGRCWSLLGLGKGDRVAIFDYGTSPVSYLASSAFTPYLKSGAADASRCQPICNDGTANMSQRAIDILKFVRPRVLFIRRDCVQPFTLEVERLLPRLSDYTQALVVAENEGLLSKADQSAYERRLGVPVYRLLRIDVAMFLAMECPKCRLLHSWQDLYFLESTPVRFQEPAGELREKSLVITNWFARTCPTVRYLSQVDASLESAGCPKGADDIRISA
jgi:phenylacetate-coenzyme A ligase PaaK-like adenylate-forming protein